VVWYVSEQNLQQMLTVVLTLGYTKERILAT